MPLTPDDLPELYRAFGKSYFAWKTGNACGAGHPVTLVAADSSLPD